MNERLTTGRIKNILQAIIMQYIYTGEPVGSNMLSKKHIPELSPATLRNVMSEMEEMGYLRQPHASAGRIPTDKGFRFYIDCILKVKKLSQPEMAKIKTRCHRSQEIEKVMFNTSSILSSLSDCMGVVLAPRFENVFIKHMEFIKLGKKQVMMLLVSNSGIVLNRIVKIEDDLEQHDMERMSAYLNGIARGLTLRKLKAKIVEEMKKEKNLYDQLLSKALKLSKIALDKDENTDNVYVDGKTNIFDQPEFIEDAEKMKLLFRAFEEKSVLIKILDKAIDAKGVHIFIGSESGFNEINGCSIITAPYGSSGNVFGTLGVIGPTRMNYSRIIPLVNYTAALLSDIMTRREAL
ncbi:MAG: heat-inducible transcription repressor HrcA [Deltaproteobacteria bacterium]|nr:heat-inducible transcription repressor HrcA [Deltaproteobacteria bacterium]